MTNYFKRDGQSSGNLGTFRNGGNPCGDMVLEQERLEAAGLFWTPPMEMGNAMESLLQDMATRSKLFDASFFVSNVDKISFSETDGKRSHASEVLWTAKHWKGNVGERLLELIERKTKTDKNGKKSDYDKFVNANELARECIDNPGRLPITQKDFRGIKTLANKIMEMPLPEWWWGMIGWKVGDFLEHQQSRWQEEIYWDACEIDPSISDPIIIKKKSKLDVLLVHGGVAGIIDLKWTGSFPTFMSRLRAGKWIQAAHYEESVRAKYGVRVLPMLYVVGISGTTKGEPTLVTALAMKDGPCTKRNRCFCGACRDAEYHRTCLDYHQWEKSGRGRTGFLKSKEVEVWT